MVSALFNEPGYIASKKLLDASQLRHEALAGNIAHLETPGYQRLDVEPSFVRELQKALAARDCHRIRSLEPKLKVDTAATAHGRDGNTVQLETELAELIKNARQMALQSLSIGKRA